MRFKRKWTLRKVVEQKRRREINMEIGEEPGSGSYLSKYPGAVSTVLGRLSEETRTEYLEVAAKWNKLGPPRDVQIRYVSSVWISQAIPLLFFAAKVTDMCHKWQ